VETEEREPPPDLRKARHDLRGRMNALMLCVSAFEVVQTRAEAVEFLDMMDRACDKLIVALDKFEAVSAISDTPINKTE
jgi:hypothetical protein